jgi:hypothetical protein
MYKVLLAWSDMAIKDTGSEYKDTVPYREYKAAGAVAKPQEHVQGAATSRTTSTRVPSQSPRPTRFFVPHYAASGPPAGKAPASVPWCAGSCDARPIRAPRDLRRSLMRKWENSFAVNGAWARAWAGLGKRLGGWSQGPSPLLVDVAGGPNSHSSRIIHSLIILSPLTLPAARPSPKTTHRGCAFPVHCLVSQSRLSLYCVYSCRSTAPSPSLHRRRPLRNQNTSSPSSTHLLRCALHLIAPFLS